MPRGARTVLDHHRLAERVRELRRDQARHEIGGARRGEADDEVDRLRFGQSCAAAANDSAARRNAMNRMKESSARMLPSSVKILFASQTEKAEVWLPLLRHALPQDEFVAVPDKSVEIALIATPPAGTFQKLGRPRS